MQHDMMLKDGGYFGEPPEEDEKLPHACLPMKRTLRPFGLSQTAKTVSYTHLTLPTNREM